MMVPMVTEVAELKEARSLLQKEIERQSKIGEQLPKKLQFGAMLEVPALLWQLDELMEEVDFVSVGSNDLFQFIDGGRPRQRRASPTASTRSAGRSCGCCATSCAPASATRRR